MRIAIILDGNLFRNDGIAISILGLVKSLRKKKYSIGIFYIGKSNLVKNEKKIKYFIYKGIENPLYKDLLIPILNPVKIIKQLREFNPDLIYVNTPFNLGALAMCYSKYYSCPTIYTEHAVWEFLVSHIDFTLLNSFKKKIKGFLKLLLFNQFIIYVCIAKLLITLNWLRKKIPHINNSQEILNRIPLNEPTNSEIFIETQNKFITILLKKITNLYLNSFYKLPQSITVSTVEMYRTLRKLYNIKKDVFIYPLGIEEPNNFRKIKIEEKTVIRLVTVGRLSYEKRIQDLILAVHFLRKDNPYYNLTIVGDGPEYDNLVKFSQKLNLDNYIYFRGLTNHNLISEVYKNADIFLNACLIESQCIAALEAMSYGIPIIGYKSLGLINMVSDNTSGLLVEPKRPELLANAIKELSTNKRLYNFLSEQSKKNAENFYYEKLNIKWEELFRLSIIK